MVKINSIEWHEENLRNYTNYYNLRKQELKDLEDDVSRMKNGIIFLKEQIETAKSKKLEEFDADKYLIKNKKTTETIHESPEICKKHHQCDDCKFDMEPLICGDCNNFNCHYEKK